MMQNDTPSLHVHSVAFIKDGIH